AVGRRGFRAQPEGERARGLLHFFEQRRADGEQVATGQLENFADIAETGAHDLGWVAVFLVVIVNARDRQHTGVFGRRIGIAPGRFFIPVEDASDERRNELYAGFGTRDGLGEREK